MKESICYSIDSDESLENWLGKETLLVFDIYQNWSGECEVVQPLFDQLSVTIDEAKTRIALLTLESNKADLVDKFSSLVSYSDRVVELGYENDEADESKTSDDIKDSLKKMVVKKDSQSEPLFCVVKNKRIVAVIKGANQPALKKIIVANLPPIIETENFTEEPED
ncbi:predicted protein [Chaetoceros tenuissimus]|uniref:Thioredoxin domain-containing protein n=1 Tax=Chaetoceros tenuissimus TaxID=426638 RepID=A0AAD3CWI2_9STRA|nr:predicted protein [Chaetoceros tenuissimus]